MDKSKNGEETSPGSTKSKSEEEGGAASLSRQNSLDEGPRQSSPARRRGSIGGDENITRQRHQIVVGICAMDKKARSDPMTEILKRLPSDIFKIVIFGDKVILEKPVEEWPKCDCLISFFSKGFPLSKAEEYAKKYQPFCVNDLSSQRLLWDRRKVYARLAAAGVPVPRHVVVNRDGAGPPPAALVEHDDYIEVDGERINKPFVEKPVDAEDHNIHIYYPPSAGGGSKRLFRKVGDRSSRFYPEASRVRREGSFLYEEFLETQGTDVKVYTVGPFYGHAEARKSPALDGKVVRDAAGKELRFPVILAPAEKRTAAAVVRAFRQYVCGFDLLRCGSGRAVVCDVNGWSFVKKNKKYYDSCAQLLGELMLSAQTPGRVAAVSALAPLLRGGPRHPPRGGKHPDGRQTWHSHSPHGGGGGGGGGGRASRVLAARRSRSRQALSMVEGDGGDPFFGAAAGGGLGTATDSVDPGAAGGGAGPQPSPAPDAPPPPPPPPGPAAAATGGASGGDPNASFDEEQGMVRLWGPGGRGARRPPRPPGPGEGGGGGGGAGRGRRADSARLCLDSLLMDETLHLVQPQATPLHTAPGSTPGAGSSSFSPPDSPASKAAWDASPFVSKDAYAWEERDRRASGGTGTDLEDNLLPEELRCVIAVVRHGDRTPKQKLKMKVRERPVLDFYLELSGGKHDKGVKVKTQANLRRFQQIVREVLADLEARAAAAAAAPEEREGGEEAGAGEADGGGGGGGPGGGLSAGQRAALEQYRVVAGVLGARDIQGITRKVQLKPTAHGEDGRPTQLQLVAKWGGELTALGRRQAERLGARFRQRLYPDPTGGAGILQLHSTFRHDLKLRSSDEGRVMKTAAAFAQGLLELEGDLTPIVVSLVLIAHDALDRSGNEAVKPEMALVKARLQDLLQRDLTLTEEAVRALFPGCSPAAAAALRALGNPRAALGRLLAHVQALVRRLEELQAEEGPGRELYHEETVAMCLARWRKLRGDLYDPGRDRYDLSKVPDVHDNVRYDALHNVKALGYPRVKEFYREAKGFADGVVGQEYGMNPAEKAAVGTKICAQLLRKVQEDLRVACQGEQAGDFRHLVDASSAGGSGDLGALLGHSVRTRLYFTSESHLHGLLNALAHHSGGGGGGPGGGGGGGGGGGSPGGQGGGGDDGGGAPSPQQQQQRRAPASSGGSFSEGPSQMDNSHCTLSSSRTGSFDNLQDSVDQSEPKPSPLTAEARAKFGNVPELCYLTHLVIRLFEDMNKEETDPARFRVEMTFSPGADADPFEKSGLLDRFRRGRNANFDPPQVRVAPAFPLLPHAFTAFQMDHLLQEILERGEQELVVHRTLSCPGGALGGTPRAPPAVAAAPPKKPAPGADDGVAAVAAVARSVTAESVQNGGGDDLPTPPAEAARFTFAGFQRLASGLWRGPEDAGRLKHSGSDHLTAGNTTPVIAQLSKKSLMAEDHGRQHRRQRDRSVSAADAEFEAQPTDVRPRRTTSAKGPGLAPLFQQRELEGSNCEEDGAENAGGGGHNGSGGVVARWRALFGRSSRENSFPSSAGGVDHQPDEERRRQQRSGGGITQLPEILRRTLGKMGSSSLPPSPALSSAADAGEER